MDCVLMVGFGDESQVAEVGSPFVCKGELLAHKSTNPNPGVECVCDATSDNNLITNKVPMWGGSFGSTRWMVFFGLGGWRHECHSVTYLINRRKEVNIILPISRYRERVSSILPTLGESGCTLSPPWDEPEDPATQIRARAI